MNTFFLILQSLNMFPHSIQLQARLESQKSPFHMSSGPCYAPNTHEPKINNTRFKTFIVEAFSYDLILFLYFHHQIIFCILRWEPFRNTTHKTL